MIAAIWHIHVPETKKKRNIKWERYMKLCKETGWLENETVCLCLFQAVSQDPNELFARFFKDPVAFSSQQKAGSWMIFNTPMLVAKLVKHLAIWIYLEPLSNNCWDKIARRWLQDSFQRSSSFGEGSPFASWLHGSDFSALIFGRNCLRMLR